MVELIRVGTEVKEAAADIIFIHGLGGDALKTWNFHKEQSWHTWLSEDYPLCNIWAYSYDANPVEWFSENAFPLIDRATNFLALLDAHDIGDKPIFIIAHSLGGLVTKSVLEQTHGVTTDYLKITQNIKGIAFLATPHAGLDVATYRSYLEAITHIAGIHKSIALNDLEAHAAELRRLDSWFRNNLEKLDINIKVFFETRDTIGFRVVNESSANPKIKGITPIPVDVNHIDICKPVKKTDVVYLQSVKLFKDVNKVIEIDPSLGDISPELQISKNDEELQQLRNRIQDYIESNKDHVDAKILHDKLENLVIRSSSKLNESVENQVEAKILGDKLENIETRGSSILNEPVENHVKAKILGDKLENIEIRDSSIIKKPVANNSPKVKKWGISAFSSIAIVFTLLGLGIHYKSEISNLLYEPPETVKYASSTIFQENTVRLIDDGLPRDIFCIRPDEEDLNGGFVQGHENISVTSSQFIYSSDLIESSIESMDSRKVCFNIKKFSRSDEKNSILKFKLKLIPLS